LAAADTSVDPLSGTFATATGDIGEGHGFGGCHGDDGATFSRLLATLTDTNSNTSVGAAVFTTITHSDGSTAEILRVKVTGAEANATLDVSVTTTADDGTTSTTSVGSITTDANGNGRLILSSNPKTSNVGQLPSGLIVNSTSTISVGTSVSGTFSSSSSVGSSSSLASRFSPRRR
jgi:hypothetical protein